jgi:TctA family transporter
MVMSMKGVFRGVKDVIHHWTLWLRCTLGGFLIGIIPGVGAMAATFMAYAHAKQTSKHPETFGTGSVEGVIAPESANNAKDGGSLLTTLALGIPGSSDLAIIIGAFVLLNLAPGPTMLMDHLPLSLSLVYVLVIANLIAVLVCFLAVKWLIRVALIPGRILSPIVIVIALTGAFASRQVFNDVTATLVFSVIGFLMARFGFNRPALMLAFVLGGLLEKYFRISVTAGGPLFFIESPLSIAIIVLIIASFAYGPLKNLIQRSRGTGAA